MPSTDMLKKLLEEFAEKEAHTREEINVITQQIEDLERRIAVSQQRLVSVSQDRAKVTTMMSRYSSGEWLSASPMAAAAAAASVAANPLAAIGGKRKKKDSTAEEPAAASPEVEQPAAKITLPSPRSSSTRLKALPDPTVPQPQPEAQPSSPFRSEPAAEPAAAEEPSRPSPNEPAFTFNSLFSSSPADEVPPASTVEEPALAQENALSSGSNWPSVSGPATQAPGPAIQAQGPATQAPGPATQAPGPATQAPGPATLAPGPSPATLAPGPGPATLAPGPSINTSPASALRSSFFSDDDDDEMLSAPSAPTASTPASNPFLKSMISGAREPQSESGPQENSAAESSAVTAASAPGQEEAPAAQVADLDDEESDDTVKSINDALRGLFR